MVKQIVRDTFLLSQSSKEAAKADIGTGIDLMDTLRANSDRCVGLAANMIGGLKGDIIVHTEATDLVMFNPVITNRSDKYEACEGCLSMDGLRKTVRFSEIDVRFRDMNWKIRTMHFSGYTAQILLRDLLHNQVKLQSVAHRPKDIGYSKVHGIKVGLNLQLLTLILF